MTETIAENDTVVIDDAAAPAQIGKRRRNRRRTVGIWTGRLLLLIVPLAIWEIAAQQGTIDTTFFGSPFGTWNALWEYLPSAQAASSLQATAIAVLLTFVIGSVMGTLFGLILGLSTTVNSLIDPFLGPINSLPRIALAPLFIAWFGLTINAKVFLGVSIVFFLLAENARSAVRSVDSDLMTMGRVVGLTPPALLVKVVLPSAVPTMFAGLRLSFTYSVLGVIASEMIAATNGLGQDIVLYSTSYRIDTVFAILLIILGIATVVNLLFARTERRLLRWQE
jgi:NitT/TauT family transport system permease protein